MSEKRTLISDICNKVAKYLDEEQIKKIYDAYLVAAHAHDGQYRKSGEAYVFHPLSVAMILVDLKVDYESIIAAILHDCIEDTSVTKEQISQQFGEEVAHIVDGVSKLDGIENKSISEKQTKNFRKLLLAASKDIRVIVIKLADRTHNMRTIDAMSRDSQIRIAKETEEVYIPISRRIGLGKITKELKDLTFKTIHPIKYKTLALKLQGKFDKNHHLLRDAISMFESQLKDNGINAKITGRKKNIVSIYQKMRDKKLKFSQILDLYGVRITVDSVNECYQVLGLVHNSCSPIPGSFKDYIALPKNNGYQSLHTVVFGKNRQSIEVQIRTLEMDGVAGYGLASHWYYKNNHADNPSNTLSPNWIKNISTSGDSDEEFLSKAKAEMSSDDVFVFTPKGDIIQLPYNATALDFAYELHTDIGDKAIRVKIDNVNTSLATKIKSGQTISVITSPSIKASIEWINIATTIRAKSAIKQTLKNNFPAKLVNFGREILADGLYYNGVDIENIEWEQHLQNLAIDGKANLFIKIALKEILLSKVMTEIIGDGFSYVVNSNVKSSQNLTTSYAKCCYPLPGDKVVGVLSLNKGLYIHRENCNNAKNTNEIDWKTDIKDLFETKIICDTGNNRGNLAKVVNFLQNENIVGVEIKNNLIEFIFKVRNVQKLQNIIQSLNSLNYIDKAYRVQ
jgi:guanosine-3',5'-bis(diphosphate) 3'-pyrophosphohydrolase